MEREQTSIPNTEYTTATGRYDESRKPIDLIVLHSTASTLQSAIALFGSAPAAGKETSAHYIIENDGVLYQGLEEYYTAYHCGNYEKNQRSIGIEHVDNGPTVKLHTDAQYEMSAKLVADICKFYNIPCDSAHIVPHNSIIATACPNGLDVNRIISRASQILGGTPTTDNCPAELAQVKAERDRLNTIIGTVKDPQIEQLKKDVATAQASTSSCLAEKNSLSVQLAECQRQAAVYKAEYDKAIADTGYIAQIKQLEESKVTLNKEITNLNTKLTKVTNQYNTLKKPGLKFIQAAVMAICEKLGVQI